MTTDRYLSISRIVQRIFSVLSAVELALTALALPAFILRATWAVFPLAIIGACVLVQAVALSFAQRAQTWAGRDFVKGQTAPPAGGGQPMQGKKGYRNFGPRGKVSRRELERQIGLRGDGPVMGQPHIASARLSKVP